MHMHTLTCIRANDSSETVHQHVHELWNLRPNCSKHLPKQTNQATKYKKQPCHAVLERRDFPGTQSACCERGSKSRTHANSEQNSGYGNIISASK